MPSPIEVSNLTRWCALTLEPYRDEIGHMCSSAVQAAHMIPKATDDEQRRDLERMWGLPNLHLDVLEHDLNLIPLRADWHRGLDNGDWFLLPRESTLNAIGAHLAGNFGKPKATFPKQCPWFKSDKKHLALIAHRYQLVPCGERSMNLPLIRRKFVNEDKRDKLGKKVFETFTPPNFDDYPLIHSTVHPYTVIWKAVLEFGDRDTNSLPRQFRASMAQAQLIVATWKKGLHIDDDAVPEALPPPGADAASSASKSSRRWIRNREDKTGAQQPNPSDPPSGRGNTGQQYAVDPHEEIPYSETVVSEDAATAVSEESEDHTRPCNIMPTEAPEARLDQWRKNVVVVSTLPLKDDDALPLALADDTVQIRESSPFVNYQKYQKETPAPLPAGDWVEWQAEYTTRAGLQNGRAAGDDMDQN
ncbi:uncharacterized protein STEHIDRAFT_172456 [Stereum hirsutum FP-91666 SS1]|uniref:uncharacterized protein n=1 Tax=Stereum hirsutum (strain FP-91666) TaxID=721885 RepID=UPI0004449CEA|nr:uncharacterized protein STEHIDRAFT_172456 [Stereum hirsutum FP-91666 SS1]EIM80735.1 hypothetical protein STEHIDRAFT_172456 [Stereum hirsutum FP-91666 SS1]